MGNFPVHWEESGRLQPQDGPHFYGEATKEEDVWDMGLPPLVEAMVKAFIQEVETSFACQHNTSTQYVATRPIMDLCLLSEQRSGTRVSKRWWGQ